MTDTSRPYLSAFDTSSYNPSAGCCKLGEGELGGKADGLILLGQQLEQQPFESFQGPDGKKIRVTIPPALVVATGFFDMFLRQNQLDRQALEQMSDEHITAHFSRGQLPDALTAALRHYLHHNHDCLAVRSSSLMEDTRQFGYAGLYRSVMLANDQPDSTQRFASLAQAVKQVYASTFFKAPRTYARRLGHPARGEKMAVILQPVVGSRYKNLFFPAISGIAQSHNFYPLPPMQHEDGLVALAMGLGQIVVTGERSLHFCPKYPQHLPQRSNVAEVLANSQTHFYALQTGRNRSCDGLGDTDALIRCDLAAVSDAPFMRYVASTWNPVEDRIRDTIQMAGSKVLTFAPILKQRLFPLSELIENLLFMGQRIMNCPVEIEFAVDFGQHPQALPTFGVLQLRPMSARPSAAGVHIEEADIAGALCYSQAAMGNTDDDSIADIVYIKPEHFDAARTRDMANQVAQINYSLTGQARRYVLIGPGRWGSQDPWLGIPVKWQHICGVGAIVETGAPRFKPEFSQGAHLFHNLTAAGICYLCISESPPDHLDWQWLAKQPKQCETDYLAHVRLPNRLRLKVDGRTARGLITTLEST